MAVSSPVPDHIEANLGRIDPSAGYWRWSRPDGVPLQVLCFPGCPANGARTICTLGLSRHEFRSVTGPVRQELLLAAWDRFICDELAATLASIGIRVLDAHVALRIGEIFGPAGPLLPGCELEAILCLPPDPYPSSFAVCSMTKPPTDFLRLVPILAEEAVEAKAFGTTRLLLRWERDGTDLLNFDRA